MSVLCSQSKAHRGASKTQKKRLGCSELTELLKGAQENNKSTRNVFCRKRNSTLLLTVEQVHVRIEQKSKSYETFLKKYIKVMVSKVYVVNESPKKMISVEEDKSEVKNIKMQNTSDQMTKIDRYILHISNEMVSQCHKEDSRAKKNV